MFYTGPTVVSARGVDDCVRLAETAGTPDPMGTRHRPISHLETFASLLDAGKRHGLDLMPEMALNKETKGKPFGANMYLALQMEPTKDRDGLETIPAMVYRCGNTQLYNHTAGAGLRWTICENSLLEFEELLMQSKSTTFRNLRSQHDTAMQGLSAMIDKLQGKHNRLADTEVSNTEAKKIMFDMAFGVRHTDSVVSTDLALDEQKGVSYCFPPSKLGEIGRNFFHNRNTMPDCAPNSLSGILGAVTRALRGQSPDTKVEQTDRSLRYLTTLAA